MRSGRGILARVLRTVILCGGKGTRAFPHTVEVPKPLLEVGDRPLLHHVLDLYASQGHTRFVLAAGYKAQLIAEFARTLPSAWDVEVVATGVETGTAGRLWRVRDVTGPTFFCTYGDGLGDVDLAALLEFHRAHGRPATLTTVPLPSPYGTVDVDGDGRVTNFEEKPRLDDHRINAGFFVFDHAVFEHWAGDDLERETLPSLAARGDLGAYAHTGFWKSADTYKDTQELGRLFEQGAPWLRADR